MAMETLSSELTSSGIKLIPFRFCQAKEEAIRAGDQLGYPVALKAFSRQVTHKTEIGGVMLNIGSGKEMALAWEKIRQRTQGYQLDGTMVQKMARKGIELIVGGKQDPQFCQLILFGLGGIYVEVFRDISVRVCPISKQDADEMIHEIKAYPLIGGVRGLKPVNEKALQELLLKVSDFLVAKKPKELDLNPVIADAKGYDVVDYRIVR